jgi:uncharacterized 2Fe-2S/4Fe-4S cluster protein (DUF4445 family)
LIQVMAGELSSVSPSEESRISPSRLEEGYRLACEARVLGDCRVNVPPSSLTTAQRIQTEGRELGVHLDPVMRGHELQVAPASREDLRSDQVRFEAQLAADVRSGLSVTLDAAQQLPRLLRSHDWRVKAAVRGNKVTAVLPPSKPLLGFAVDLGTTKLAGYLVNLETGETLAAAGVMNPQIAYGEDVMARLTYVVQQPEGAQKLQSVIVAGLDDLARTLCGQVGERPCDIVEAVIVGNTAMHHLLLGLPTEQLGAAPYVAAWSGACDLLGSDIGFKFAPNVRIHILPNIAGFVGADHVAMLLGSGMYAAQDVVLGLDIGTNTEVGLKLGGGANGRLLVCSTASGPAFEGAHIKAGMRAGPGAIERVWIDGDRVATQVIGDRPPVGLCGSGILDAVGQLHKLGLLSETGAMSLEHSCARQGEQGPEFVLAPRSEGANEHDIVLTRGDVSEIQLAKGAMRAGTEVLMREAGISVEDLDRIVIAGAFGSYIDVSNALRIGMFPPLPVERFEQVGNAAGVGARMALLSGKMRELASEVAGRAEYVELTNDPRFTLEFTEAMMLP